MGTRLLIALCLLVAACGGGESPFTWGAATAQISEGFCNRLATCGYFGDDENSPEKREQCISHTEFHFCLDGTCETELPAEAQAEADACVLSLESADCFLLGYYGFVPEECGPIFDREPTDDAGA